MALPPTTVSRQAPRPRPVATVQRVRTPVPVSFEDDGFEEIEEPAPVKAEPRPPRITVNGRPVKRIQIDFGSNATAFHPTGSVMERFWDQHDGDPDKDKYSRPRIFADAIIEVHTDQGFLNFTARWPDKPGVTKLVQPTASMSYEE